MQPKCNCVIRKYGRKRKKELLFLSTLEHAPSIAWKQLYSSISTSLSILRFLFHPSFLLCGSWQTNLNLFRWDITQQLCSCSGASPLGSPVCQPAPARGSSGARLTLVLGGFPSAVHKHSAQLLQQRLSAIVPIVPSPASHTETFTLRFPTTLRLIKTASKMLRLLSNPIIFS